MVNIKLLPLG